MLKVGGRRKIQAVCIALLLCLMTGCSGVDNSGTDTEKIMEKTTIKWMVYGEKSRSSDNVVREFNQELQKFYPDIEVEFEIVPIQSYKDKWNIKMATNEELDLVWIGNDVLNYTEEVKKGEFMALDYLLSTDGKELQESISTDLWNIQKRDGKIYSVPILGPLYRKEYALVTSKSNMTNYADMERIKETNQSAPYTNAACYAVIEEYLENLKNNHKLGSGVSCDTFSRIAMKGMEGLYGWDSPFVIRIFDEDMKVYNKYELEEYRLYFKTMYEWYQKGYIRQDIDKVLDLERDKGTKTGNALFLDEAGENGASIDRIDTEYEAIQIPLQTYKYIPYESCRNAVAIPKTTQNPQEAMKILNLLNSEKGAYLSRLLCNGFEGRHYVNRKGNRIDRVKGEKGETLYFLSPYSICNVFLNYETVTGEFNQIKEYNKEAISSPLSGFELDIRMIALEMEEIQLLIEPDLETLKNGTAKKWEEVYTEMLNRMNEAGAKKVVSEMQKQIDVFRENS